MHYIWFYKKISLRKSPHSDPSISEIQTRPGGTWVQSPARSTGPPSTCWPGWNMWKMFEHLWKKRLEKTSLNPICFKNVSMFKTAFSKTTVCSTGRKSKVFRQTHVLRSHTSIQCLKILESCFLTNGCQWQLCHTVIGEQTTCSLESKHI